MNCVNGRDIEGKLLRVNKITKIIMWFPIACALLFSLVYAAPESAAKNITEVNTSVHITDSGWRKEVYHLLPAPCDIWVKVDELPEDAELDDADQFVEATKMVDPMDVEYLAIAIYCEAGADYISDETRYMVGDVVLNRVADERFPDTIGAVLAQKAQYGRFYWTGIVWPARAGNASEAHAVTRAREIAENLLTDARHSELYGEGYIWQSEFAQGKDNIVSDGIVFGR